MSQRLRRLRTALGLSCRAFDRAAGRTEGTCAIIEGRDTDDITRPVAESYANAAGVPIAWLMLGVGDEPQWQTLAAARSSRAEAPTGTGG